MEKNISDKKQSLPSNKTLGTIHSINFIFGFIGLNILFKLSYETQLEHAVIQIGILIFAVLSLGSLFGLLLLVIKVINERDEL